MAQATYDTILFDFGGVLLPVDYTRVTDAFAAMGADKPDEFFSQVSQHDLFSAYEKGETSSAEFLAGLRTLFPEIPETALQDAWNSILGEMPASRLALLEKVRKHYRIILLSNTNALHAASFEKQFSDRFGRLPGEWFDAVYYSFEHGYKKPQREIFDLVLLEHNLQASRTLFFEDTPANVQGATEAGIATVFVNIPEGVCTEGFFLPDGQLNSETCAVHLHLPKGHEHGK